jgi:hypothetical protein
LLDLKGLGVDLDLTGFDLTEIDDLLARIEGTGGLTDPDSVPEVPENPVSHPGNLWVLGKHRILCGDATLLSAGERVLEGGFAHMVFTDPPYNAGPAAQVRPARPARTDPVALWRAPVVPMATAAARSVEKARCS